jgi:hypothetical protein
LQSLLGFRTVHLSPVRARPLDVCFTPFSNLDPPRVRRLARFATPPPITGRRLALHTTTRIAVGPCSVFDLD